MLCPFCPGTSSPQHIVTHMLEEHAAAVQETAARIHEHVSHSCDLFSLAHAMQETGSVQVAMAVKNAGVFSVNLSPLAAAALVQETLHEKLTLFMFTEGITYRLVYDVSPGGLSPLFLKDLATVRSAKAIARKELAARTYYVPILISKHRELPRHQVPLRLCVYNDDKDTGEHVCRLWPK